MLEKELTNLGLSDKEAKVYLAAIQLGPAPVQKISQKAKVNRATTYVIIESLMDMGLMSTYDEGKKTFYVAEKPDRMLDYFKEKEKDLHGKIGDLKELLPEMMLLYSDFSDRPKVKYYEGVEGLKAVYRDFSKGQRKEELIYTFLPVDEFNDSVLAKELTAARKKRVAKGVRMKVIYTSEKGRVDDYENKAEQNLEEYKFVDYKKCPFKGGMNIYGNKIFMIDYRGSLGGVVIENHTMADAMKSFFELLWNSIG